jgi:glycosyltransferase involved in cell wall biosynthesis
MKVALVYDRVNKWGGAERVLLALREIWPDAPLYTGVYNPESAKWAKVFDIRPTFVQKFPLAKKKHELYPWLLTLGFESLSFDEFDVVISVTSAEAKGIITKPETLHICYCLTPTRYLWSHKDLYLSSKGSLFQKLAKPFISYLSIWDKVASARPDYYISISKNVQRRVEKYYKRESEVIYPPVETEWVMGSDNTLPFLVVSRLVPYKRVDLAIKACNKLKLPLVVIGDGSESNRLRELAGRNVKFVSSLTDIQLVRYYQKCKALIMPQEEDFGLAAVEAQANGKPVLAFGKGGALETVIEGKTGEFFNRQSVNSLVSVLEKFDESKYNRKTIRRNAERFSKERFKREFRKCVEERYKQFRVTRNT